jgi:hypothetical protein
MRKLDGWLRACRKLFDHKARKGPHRKFTRLECEPLEDRVLMIAPVPIGMPPLVFSSDCDTT